MRRFVSSVRQQPAVEARVVIASAPGEEGQVDYGEGPMVRDADSGKYRRTRLFVLTLGYSRKAVRLLVQRSSAQVWAELHEQSKPLPDGNDQAPGPIHNVIRQPRARFRPVGQEVHRSRRLPAARKLYLAPLRPVLDLARQAASSSIRVSQPHTSCSTVAPTSSHERLLPDYVLDFRFRPMGIPLNVNSEHQPFARAMGVEQPRSGWRLRDRHHRGGTVQSPLKGTREAPVSRTDSARARPAGVINLEISIPDVAVCRNMRKSSRKFTYILSGNQ